MTDERMKTLKVGRNIGAALGAIVFLVFGLGPAFYFGSFGTIALLSHLAGGPVEPGILVRMMTAVGIMLGFVCIASVSIIVGAIGGTTLAFLTDVISGAVKGDVEREKAYAANK